MPRSFDRHLATAGKAAARAQWNAYACGTGGYLADLEPESVEWFDRIRTNRYEVSDPWMLSSFDFSSACRQRVLEIGHGIGSDLLSWAEGGAEVHGIDITEEHHRLAKRNFALHDREATLTLADAASIPYPSAYFDVVYSHGVLHHTVDMEACVAEARRVLRPGGRFLMSLYHRHSAYHYANLLLANGVARGKLWKLGYAGLLATIEHGADGIDLKPYVRLYARREVEKLLADFRTVSVHITHFEVRHIPLLWRLIPRRLEPALARSIGWYVVSKATK